MEYADWKGGQLNRPWKEMFPSLWEKFVKDKNPWQSLKTTIRERIEQLERWWKWDRIDASAEIHHLREILDKVEWLETLYLTKVD